MGHVQPMQNQRADPTSQRKCSAKPVCQSCVASYATKPHRSRARRMPCGASTTLQWKTSGRSCKLVWSRQSYGNSRGILTTQSGVRARPWGVAAGDDVQTQHVVDSGFLDVAQELMQAPNVTLRKETCWALSNVGAGNFKQIQAMLDTNYIHPTILLLMTSQFEVQRECTWVLSNLIAGGTTEQVHTILQAGAIKGLAHALTLPDTAVLEATINALKRPSNNSRITERRSRPRRSGHTGGPHGAFS